MNEIVNLKQYVHFSGGGGSLSKIKPERYFCNYQRILKTFIIKSFLTQKKLNYHREGTTSESMVRETNDNSA